MMQFMKTMLAHNKEFMEDLSDRMVGVIVEQNSLLRKLGISADKTNATIPEADSAHAEILPNHDYDIPDSILDNYSSSVSGMLYKLAPCGNRKLETSVNKTILTTVGCLNNPLHDKSET